MIHNSGNLEPISLQSESISGLVNNKLVTISNSQMFFSLPHHPVERRLFVVFLVQSLSDAAVARIRIALAKRVGNVHGFIVAQLGRTNRGLTLSPLGVDEVLDASYGVSHLYGCAGLDRINNGPASLCAHVILPPQPNGLFDDDQISSWRRLALFAEISSWMKNQTVHRNVSWWPLLPDDVLLYFDPSVIAHPDALRGLLSMIASNSINYPSTLPVMGEYVYHLGLFSSEKNKLSDGRIQGGGLVVLADQITSFDFFSPTHSLDLPGSAILSLFGGTDAVIQQRLTDSLDAKLWGENFGHHQIHALSNSIDQGIDVRNRINKILLKTTMSSSDMASFSALITSLLDIKNYSGSISSTELSSLHLSTPRTRRSRYLLSYLVGRLGNYFINLLNSLALARVSNRVAVLLAPENPKEMIFSHFFQLPYIPWTPFVKSLPESFPSSTHAITVNDAVCMNTREDGFPHACGQDRSLPNWVNEVGGVCTSFLSAPVRSHHPYKSPMLQLMGINESEVLNPDSHPMGTLGTYYHDEVLTGSRAFLAQAFNYYDYDFSNQDEWLKIRCAVDFSEKILTEAWKFVGPNGPLNGEPFFSIHARLEDFSSAYPGEDTSPPLDDFVTFAGILASRFQLKKVFVATNGTPKEKEAIFLRFSQMGLLALTHPLSDDSLMGKFVDAAVASHAFAFLGNKMSTYSHIIAGQMFCAGISHENIIFFRAKAYENVKKNKTNMKKG